MSKSGFTSAPVFAFVACVAVYLFQAAPLHAADTTPPSVPTQLVAVGVSPSQVNLRWAASTDNVGVAGYNVYRNGVLAGTPTGTGFSGTTTGTGTGFSDTGLTPNTVYTYTVKAFDAARNLSAASTAATATTLPAMNIPSAAHIPPFYTCVTNYYVSQSGNDTTGNGSSGMPWLTISRAVAFLNALGGTQGGVCVNVGPGTYSETNGVNANALSGSSDSATGYFVLRSITPQGATIQRPSTGDYFSAISFVDASYVVIDGFSLVGTDAAPNIDGSGISAVGSSASSCLSHHIRIFNNVVYGFGGSGIGTYHADYYDVEGNVVYNNANTSTYGVTGINHWHPVAYDSGTWNTVDSGSVQFHYIIRGNVAFNNEEVSIGANVHADGNGIILDDFNGTQTTDAGIQPYLQQSLVENNLSFDNGGAGILDTGSYITIRNNTTFSNYLDAQNPYTAHGEISNGSFAGTPGGAHNNFIVNNIAIANPNANATNYALADWANGSPNTNDVWANNLSFNGTPGLASISLYNTGSVIAAANGNLLGVDPLVVNYLTGDFTLKAASPAIGSGTTAYGVALTDLAGNPRTTAGKVDMGAYEYESSAGSGSPASALAMNVPTSAAAGTPFNVNVFLFSNGSGTPTGNVSILAVENGGAPQPVGSVSAAAASATPFAAGNAGAPASVTLSMSGPSTLSASYAGDANFAAATSPGYSINLPADFSLATTALAPSAVGPGMSATATVGTSAVSGFSGTLSLTCSVQSTLPLAPTCKISPNSLSAGAPATLTVYTTGPSAALLPGAGSGLYALCLPLLGLVATRVGLKSKTRRLACPALLCGIFTALVFQVACSGGSSSSGGSGGNSGTPPGIYNITVNGSDASGTLQHSLAEMLTVQ